jgi:hypothetical protein
MCSYSQPCMDGAEPRQITSVSTENSSHLPLNMYNLGAFDLCGCQQYPALQRDLPYSVTCLTA